MHSTNNLRAPAYYCCDWNWPPPTLAIIIQPPDSPNSSPSTPAHSTKQPGTPTYYCCGWNWPPPTFAIIIQPPDSPNISPPTPAHSTKQPQGAHLLLLWLKLPTLGGPCSLNKTTSGAPTYHCCGWNCLPWVAPAHSTKQPQCSHLLLKLLPLPSHLSSCHSASRLTKYPTCNALSLTTSVAGCGLTTLVHAWVFVNIQGFAEYLQQIYCKVKVKVNFIQRNAKALLNTFTIVVLCSALTNGAHSTELLLTNSQKWKSAWWC